MSGERYIVDSGAFAREGRHLAGREPVARFERLSALVVAPSGDVVFDVSGSTGNDGDRFLDMTVSATIAVQCQRCLEAMSWPVAVSSRLLLVAPEQALPDEALEEDEFDSIHASSKFDLLAAVEDEILLALPFAARHEHCEAPGPTTGAVKESPFAVLGQMQVGKGTKN